MVTCLNAAGVKYAVLGQEESCTGDPARRMGNDYVFQMLATGNVETLNRYQPKTIITACPHCFNTLGNEYGQLGGTTTSSITRSSCPSSSAMAGCASTRAASSRHGHDSCYLARYNGVIGETREVLKAVPGIELREMDKNGTQTFCCGAGGGRMWMEEKRGTRVNAERTRQALDTGAEAVATACPFCLVMLRDGVADAGERGTGVRSRTSARSSPRACRSTAASLKRSEPARPQLTAGCARSARCERDLEKAECSADHQRDDPLGEDLDADRRRMQRLKISACRSSSDGERENDEQADEPWARRAPA